MATTWTHSSSNIIDGKGKAVAQLPVESGNLSMNTGIQPQRAYIAQDAFGKMVSDGFSLPIIERTPL